MEFKEYRNDKALGKEYEIIQHWAEDSKMQYNFKLDKERTTVIKTADDVLDKVNRDPYGLNSPEPDEQVKARTQFIDSHSTKDTNKAVAFYMISALEYFKDKPQETVKSIAMEFATLGMAGIDPKKKNYEVPSISKKMTGYQALAYYYVSWAIGVPEMLNQLGMPFDKEYKLAKEMEG